MSMSVQTIPAADAIGLVFDPQHVIVERGLLKYRSYRIRVRQSDGAILYRWGQLTTARVSRDDEGDVVSVVFRD
jgi:hypothetical protein